MDFSVITFYQFTRLGDPMGIRDQLKQVCEQLDIKGRILIGEEGINGGASGTTENIARLKKSIDELFPGITYRELPARQNAYRKLVVRARKEIVALGKTVDPQQTGNYLTPDQFKNLLETNEDLIILDTRNDYEAEVGKFKNALVLPIKTFKEFPEALKQLDSKKHRKIVTYCTGGIRCEKATAYMKQQGFTDVNQIQGGVINFCKQHPGTYWEGSLFVFDDRLTADMGSGTITSCRFCKQPEDSCHNCHNLDCDKLFICCGACAEKMRHCCSEECMTAPRQRPMVNDEKQEEIIGIVENYYARAKVALIKVLNKRLDVQSTITIKGPTTYLVSAPVNEMRDYDGHALLAAMPDQLVTVPVPEKVRRHDLVVSSV